MKVKTKGLNLYYIFNRRFSYPAAFSQSTTSGLQWVLSLPGFVSTHNLNFDYNTVPEITRNHEPRVWKVKRYQIHDISLNATLCHCVGVCLKLPACLSFNPAVAYKTSRIEKTEEREADDWYKNFNIDFILRAGVVYNNSKYFVGTSFVGRTYDYYKNSFSLNNGFGTLQIYAGFNFYLKKEYRKNKK